MTRLSHLFCLGLVLALAACRTVGLPAPHPILDEDQRIGAWLRNTWDEGAQRRTLRAVGSLKLSSPSGSGRTKQVILAAQPASLRLESLNLLGQTQSLLVTDGERFAFYDGSELREGEVSKDILFRYLGLDMEPREAVRALLVAPEPEPAESPRVLGQGDDRIVDLRARRLRFSPDGELLALERRDPAGTRWRAEYQSWREVPGGRYPHSMVLSFPRQEVRAELDLKRVEINPDIDQAVFAVRPGGAR